METLIHAHVEVRDESTATVRVFSVLDLALHAPHARLCVTRTAELEDELYPRPEAQAPTRVAGSPVQSVTCTAPRVRCVLVSSRAQAHLRMQHQLLSQLNQVRHMLPRRLPRAPIQVVTRRSFCPLSRDCTQEQRARRHPAIVGSDGHVKRADAGRLWVVSFGRTSVQL